MPCPPPGYSGLEMLAWQIATGLHHAGHDVTLVAPSGSKVDCQLHPTILYESEKDAYSKYWQTLPNYDVIIDHSWQKWSYILKMEGNLKKPILGVLHAPVNTMYNVPPPVEKPCLVAISKDQSEAVKSHLKTDSRVCYNGVDVGFYMSAKMTTRNDRYLFLARMSTIKGPHIALDVAVKTKKFIDMVGDDTITGEPALVQQIKNGCNSSPFAQYIGPQTRVECASWFCKNKALLHPNQLYREPFGLAPVEAQLCGMPVIAWDNGAMRETVKHGETGFLVSSQSEMETYVRDNAVASLNPHRCREWASQFSYDNMIKRYGELCEEAMGGGW